MNINQDLRQKLLSVLIVLMFLCFVFSKALINILSVFFLVLFVVDKSENIKKKLSIAFHSKMVWLFTLLFIVQIIGLLYSQNTEFALKRIQTFIPIIYLPIVFKTEALNKTLLLKILKILKFLIPLIFLSLIVFHFTVLKRSINDFVHFTVNEFLGLSQFYLVFILLIPIIECIRLINLREHVILNILLLCSNLFLVVLLSNKTAFSFLLVVSLIQIIISFRKNFKKGFVLMTCFISFIVVSMQFEAINSKVNIFLKTTDFDFETIVTKNRFTITKNTAEHRVLINYVAVQEIWNTLPFGYGTGDYKEALVSGYKDLKFKAGIYYEYNAHNQYLAEFLKTGIMGGFIFILLMISFLIKMDVNNYYSYIILFFIFACFFESYLYRQHGIYIISFILPFLIFNTNKLVKR